MITDIAQGLNSNHKVQSSNLKVNSSNHKVQCSNLKVQSPMFHLFLCRLK